MIAGRVAGVRRNDHGDLAALGSGIDEMMSTGTLSRVTPRRNVMRLRSSAGGVNADRRISCGIRLERTDTATSADAETTTLASTYSWTRCVNAFARSGSGSSARMLGISPILVVPRHQGACEYPRQRSRHLRAPTPAASVNGCVTSLTGCSDLDLVEGQGAGVRSTAGHDVSILVVPVWCGHMRVKKVSRVRSTSSPASPGSDNYHRQCSNMARTAVVARRANPTSRRKEIPSRTATYDAA